MDFRYSGRDQLFGGVVYLIICLDPSQTHARLWERALGILWSWAWTFPPRRDPGSGRTALASQILGPGRRAALTSYCLGPGPLPWGMGRTGWRCHAAPLRSAFVPSWSVGACPPPAGRGGNTPPAATAKERRHALACKRAAWPCIWACGLGS